MSLATSRQPGSWEDCGFTCYRQNKRAQAERTVLTGVFRASSSYPLANITGLTFVLHDNNGTKMACAPIVGPGDDYWRARAEPNRSS